METQNLYLDALVNKNEKTIIIETIVDHVKQCRVDKCIQCKQYHALVFVHSKTCLRNDCSVFLCDVFKRNNKK
jgi:hypothetical protein